MENQPAPNPKVLPPLLEQHLSLTVSRTPQSLPLPPSPCGACLRPCPPSPPRSFSLLPANREIASPPSLFPHTANGPFARSYAGCGGEGGRRGRGGDVHRRSSAVGGNIAKEGEKGEELHILHHCCPNRPATPPDGRLYPFPHTFFFSPYSRGREFANDSALFHCGTINKGHNSHDKFPTSNLGVKSRAAPFPLSPHHTLLLLSSIPLPASLRSPPFSLLLSE